MINWKEINDKSIYEQLEEKLAIQKSIDKNTISTNCDAEEIEEQLDYLQEDYEIYGRKLDLIPKIGKLDPAIQERYISLLTKIENLDDISEKQKLKMMVSWGSLLTVSTKITERSDEELLVACLSLANIDIDDCQDYLMILTDATLSKAIVEKTDDLKIQSDMAADIIDSFVDDFMYDEYAQENYDKIIAESLEIVHGYSVSHTR